MYLMDKCSRNFSGCELDVMIEFSFVRLGDPTALPRPACCSLLAGCLRDLHSDPEDGVVAVQVKYRAAVLHPRL
jgi:hypothetical protein